MTEIEIILHAEEYKNEEEFIRHEIEKNLTGKLDTYLKKHVHEGDKIRVEVTITPDKKWKSGKVEVSFPGGSVRSEREHFEKMDDLIHHLFTHLKEQLAK